MRSNIRKNSFYASLADILTIFALSMLLVVQPAVWSARAFAQTIPDASAGAGQPGIGHAPNGVPLVNIVAPNSAGVSHNRFESFNVPAQGMILNNSDTVAQSQLGGLLVGNPNLGGGTARLVLSEVTGADLSRLQGFLEMHGRRAEFVLANPNGITCAGCGFINMSRATLTTGVPSFGADGDLLGLDVDGGILDIAGTGLNAQDIGALDLVARSIRVNAPIHASDLQLLSGRNLYQYGVRTVTAKTGDGKDKPGLAIDGTHFGAMYAGQINVVATEDGVGVRAPATMAASAGALQITAGGALEVHDASASSTLKLAAKGDITVEGTVTAGTGLSISGDSAVSVEGDGKLAGLASTAISAASVSNSGIVAAGKAGGSAGTASPHLSLTVQGAVANTGSIASQGSLTLDAASLGGTGTLKGAGDVVVATGGDAAFGALVTSEKASVTAGGSVSAGTVAAAASATIVSTAGGIDFKAAVNAGNFLSATATGGKIDIAAKTHVGARDAVDISANSVRNAGTLLTGLNADGTTQNTGKLTVKAAVDFQNPGTVTSGGSLDIKAGVLDSAGTLFAVSDAEIDQTAGTTDGSLSAITAGGALTLTATGSVAVEAVTVAGNASLSASDTLTVSGTVNTGDTLTLKAGKTLKTEADATAGGLNALTVETAGLDNDGALIAGLAADGSIKSQGTASLVITGKGTNAGRIQSGKTLTLAAASLVNSKAGGIAADDMLTLTGLSGGSALVLSNSGVIYSDDALVIAADELDNHAGAVLAIGDITIDGGSGGKAAKIVNRSGIIESETGDIVIRANRIENKRDQFSVVTVTILDKTYTENYGTPSFSPPGNKISPEGYAYLVDDSSVKIPHPQKGDAFAMYYDYGPLRLVQQQTQATSSSPAAYLSAGGDITLAGGDILNHYSFISAEGDITLTGATLDNRQANLTRTLTISKQEGTFNRCVGGPCLWLHNGAEARQLENIVYDSVRGEIRAGGSITGDFTGWIDNTTILQSVPSDALTLARRVTAEEPYVPVDADAGPLSDANRKLAGEIRIVDLIGQIPGGGSLIVAAAPTSRYLFETRFEFVDRGTFYGSSYFLSRVNGDLTRIPNRFAFDEALEARFIRTAVFLETGQRWLNPAYASAAAQLKNLIDNGLAAQNDLQLAVGVALTVEQIAQLTGDIVWYVTEEVNGEQVLAPRLYLAGGSRSGTVPSGALIAGDTVTLGGSDILNSGDIAAARSLSLAADGSILSLSGVMRAGEALSLSAGDDIVIATQGADVARAGGGVQSVVGRDAQVEAGGALSMVAGRTIGLIGADVSAGGDAVLVAGENIILGTVAMRDKATSDPGGDYTSWDNTTHLTSRVTAGGGLSMAAGNDLEVRGADVSAGGDLALGAGRNLSVTAVADSTRYAYSRKGGDKGGTGNSVTHRRAVLAAGGSLTLEAETGDLLLEAARLRSGEETRLSAEEGTVTLAAVTDTRNDRRWSSSSNAVWQSSRDQGGEHSYVRMVEIEAGTAAPGVGVDGGVDGASSGLRASGTPGGDLIIEAGRGVTIEYRDSGGDLAADVATLSQQPGLEWMASVQGRDDVAWTGLREVHRDWDYKSQGLSGPAAAVIAIAVSVAAGPQFSGFFSGAFGGAAAGTAASAAASAAAAGMTALTSQAAVSLISNQGDIGAVLRDLGSSASLRQLATAMVTAGVLQGAGLTVEASGFGENIRNAAMRGAVKASIEVAIDGRSPGEALTGALLGALAQGIGAEVAGEIGEGYTQARADGIDPLEFALHKALHAGLGCGIAAAGGGGCAAGAIGGAAGAVFADLAFDPAGKAAELAGEVRAGRMTEDGMLRALGEWERRGVDLTQLAGALAVFATVAETGGDVADGGNAAANVAENNALETVWDLASLALSLAELKIAITDGDTLDVLLAGGSVVLDTAAVVLPGVAGGAGYVLKTTREGGKLVAKVERLQQNALNGRAFETALTDALSHMGAAKNSDLLPVRLDGGGIAHTIPDLWGRNAGGVVEAKDVLDLSLTRQLTRQLEGAAQKGEPFNLVISPRNRKLTGPLIRALREHKEIFGGGLYRFDPRSGELTDLSELLRKADG